MTRSAAVLATLLLLVSRGVGLVLLAAPPRLRAAPRSSGRVELSLSFPPSESADASFARKPIAPIDIQVLQNQLQAVRELPRLKPTRPGSYEFTGWSSAVASDEPAEPSFRRLFTHDTWERYTGGRALARWWRCLFKWPQSSVLRAVYAPVLLVMTAAVLSQTLVARVLPRTPQQALMMQLPLSLQGAAIGLLLVFRTDNSCAEIPVHTSSLGEVGLWRRALFHDFSRQVPTAGRGAAAVGQHHPPGARARREERLALCHDTTFLIWQARELVEKSACALESEPLCAVCRYLCAFPWCLRDKLRGTVETGDDILRTLLSPNEANWVVEQRSRPLAILSLLRRLLYAARFAVYL